MDITKYTTDDFARKIEKALDIANMKDEITFDNGTDDIRTTFPNGYSDVNYSKGASKIAVIFNDEKVVCKISVTRVKYYNEEDDEYHYEGVGFDYCGKELENYLLAQDEGLSKAFAAECEFKTINGLKVYLAEKAEPLTLSEIISSYSEERVRNSLESVNDLSSDCGIEIYILSAFELYYGIEFTKKLVKFIDENDINDLKCRNCGVINGRPVFIDYSGFEGF